MNKKLIAAIAATTMAGAIGFASVASAEATFYGRVVAGAIYVDGDEKDDDGAWNLGGVGHDGGGAPGSRFGFKGSTDLGNGMEAGFKIERSIGKDATGQRHNHAYLSGGWGKLTLGQQSNPYMNARNWDQTNFYGGNFGESYRHEGIGYSLNTGGFSLNILATANNSGMSGDTGTQSVGVVPASDDYSPGIDTGVRVISTLDGAAVNAATGVVTGFANDATQYGTDTPFTDQEAWLRSTLAVADPHDLDSAVTILTSDITQVGLKGVEGKAAKVAVDDDDGIDGLIVHVGYDFGVVQLNVAHHLTNRDVELPAQAAFAPTAYVDVAAATPAEEIVRDRETATYQDQANRNAGGVDGAASRDRTAIGINGSAGPVDWYLAYNTTEQNTNNYENDINSVGGFLGFNVSETDILYAYHVSHKADRPTYDADGDVTLGEDYTETIVGYSHRFGPGVKFIAEYAKFDKDLAKDGEPNKIFLGIKYDF
ncbi:porin [Candidatus Spongiihabitans sp.]|uniref:porin n=1 Tax=Candidatus Spongiihabitans sp. TaxID=3101308 RepID=UPI003C7BF88A